MLERQGKDGHYDRFRNRAIFPITNESGKVVAFGARSLDGSEPKYLNSPETPVYSKSRALYGLSWARETISRERRAVLMEGYLDVARAIEHGVTGAVATCGTALTGQHTRLLRRFADTVVLNFDQDEAGQKAARKSLEICLEEGLGVRIVELPEGHDPDTYLKAEGAEAYAPAARRGARGGRVADAPRGAGARPRRAVREGGVLRRRSPMRWCARRTPSSARPGWRGWPSAAGSTSGRRARSCAGALGRAARATRPWRRTRSRRQAIAAARPRRAAAARPRGCCSSLRAPSGARSTVGAGASGSLARGRDRRPALRRAAAARRAWPSRGGGAR